jgi:glyoxylase-like metal-dependent hydrolase (beta-lactamase superfamily II)
MLVALGAMLGAVLCLNAAAQPGRFDAVQIKTTKLTATIYMLEGEGGNIGVSAGEDGVFLIDDEFAPLTDRILAAIKAISDKPVRFILNTHWHFDHTNGNENHGKAGVVIIAQDNVRKRLTVKQMIDYFKKSYGPMPPSALPVITFAETVTFHMNGDVAATFHAPHAHTDGDVIVHFRKSNVVHMGDVYFSFMYPFIDAGTGGSVRGTIAAVDRVLKITDDNTKIIPGHGPLSNKKELQGYRDMLAKVAGRIEKMIKSGKNLQQVIAAQPTREFDAVWGKGFLKPEQFVEVVYSSLAPRKK